MFSYLIWISTFVESSRTAKDTSQILRRYSWLFGEESAKVEQYLHKNGLLNKPNDVSLVVLLK